MNATNKAFPLAHLIVMTATGTLDLKSSKLALKSIADEPSFNEQTEVLLDLRDIKCQLSTADIFELAQHMTFPNPALATNKKIALLVGGHLSFDHAHFLELCANNRGASLKAFDEYEFANKWLYAELPPDPAKPEYPALLNQTLVGARLQRPHRC